MAFTLAPALTARLAALCRRSCGYLKAIGEAVALKTALVNEEIEEIGLGER
jgi:hypothetical protein